MKIDRLIGVITVLLQNEKVTASYLAERFEVSKRTIHRDIEDICKAGVPVVTLQGSSGGIALAEGYKIDKTLFTQAELQAVFAGLSSLDSVARGREYRNIMAKFSGAEPGGHLLIDLSSHYKNTLAPKISTIRQAIRSAEKIRFDYYCASGERTVVLEPGLVVFRWSDWYVLGYDGGREDFRLYKLNRLWNLQATGQTFAPRELPADKLDFCGYYTDAIHAVILVDESVKYRLIEEYGLDCWEPDGGGKLRFSFDFTSKEYLFEWVLRFGDQAELLAPEELRRELKTRLAHALQKYCE